MAIKPILPEKSVTEFLLQIRNEDARRALKSVYIPLAKKWLKEGATLLLRGSDFVFTLPNGEAAIHFDPWTIPGSGGCLYTSLNWDSALRRYVSSSAPIPPQRMEGLNNARCAWEIARNRAIYDALLIILNPFTR